MLPIEDKRNCLSGMSPEPTPDQIRATLERLAAARNVSFAALSRKIGRNDAYLQQYVRSGTPKRLVEHDCLVLAKFFGVDERLLGARLPLRPIK